MIAHLLKYFRERKGPFYFQWIHSSNPVIIRDLDAIIRL